MATQDTYSDFDGLSNLPESLLCCNILSRLPLTDAVRSSLLSRKWRYLWTKIPHLHFSSDFFRHMTFSVGRIQDTMERILIQHDAPLETFRFYRSMPISIEAMDIHQCIRHAAKKGVKRMALEDKNTSLRAKMNLPSTFFACTTLVDLKLVSFIIPEIPTPSENFSFLRSCCLSDIGNCGDHMLQRLLELCPLLQELQLIRCRELIHLKIQAPNLNYLILLGCICVESLTADCPQLLQVKIRVCSSLAKLHLNSYSLVELKLRNCCRLSKLQLNSCLFLKEAESLEGLSIEEHSNVESLRKLSLKKCSSALSDFRCPTLFGTFPDLEELQVSLCMMGIAVVRGQEQAAREMEMVSDFTFPNLKNANLGISPDMSEKEVAVLGFLLRNAPSLKTLTLALPYCLLGDHDDQEFKNIILGLKRASAEVEIIWKEDDEEDEEEYYEVSYEDEDEEEYYEDGLDRWSGNEYDMGSDYENENDMGSDYENENDSDDDPYIIDDDYEYFRRWA